MAITEKAVQIHSSKMDFRFQTCALQLIAHIFEAKEVGWVFTLSFSSGKRETSHGIDPLMACDRLSTRVTEYLGHHFHNGIFK
jgi:hypothetical protein